MFVHPLPDWYIVKAFIKKQQQAMLYVAAVFALMMGSHYLPELLYPVQPVDFSQFDADYQHMLANIRRQGAAQPDSSRDSNPSLNIAPFYQHPQPGDKTGKNSGKRLTETPVSQKININTAGAAELMQLPRIGPKIAQRIINHREANGPFLAEEDIMNVKGIGKVTFAALKPLISVR